MLPSSSPEMLTLADVTRWINAFIGLFSLLQDYKANSSARE